MFRNALLTILLSATCALTASAWNARISPEGEAAMWPVPESSQDRAGTIYRHSSLPGPVLVAEVEVDGVLAPMAALFDESSREIHDIR